MGIGTLVGALCQDTTTTTGTGAITLANAVPAGAAPGSTTFATQFAPNAVFQTAPGNTFYAIIDGSGNIELGLGTLTSATNLTRDYVLGSYTGGVISLATATPPGSYVNFAAGTKNVYSNANLFAASVAYWARIPDDNAANIFQNIMSGTFVGVLTMGVTTVNVTIRYKVTNEGNCVITIPASTVVNGAATVVTVAGVPSFLSNVLTNSFSTAGVVTASGAQSIGAVQVVAGATPTSTGTYNILNGATLTATVTTATNNGFPAGASFLYPLF